MESQVEIYRGKDKQIEIEVRFENESVWLSQAQLGSFFEKELSVITKHIRNAFSEGELAEKGNVQNLHIANSDKLVNNVL